MADPTPAHPAEPPLDSRPLVVTLEVDAASQARFDRERAAHFPPGRTQVGAHVTLFHALPGREAGRVHGDLAVAAARPAFEVLVAGVMPLGRGVAYRLESPALVELHRGLQSAWWELLTAQDRQPFRPHVTVQNKVAPEEARRTLALLEAGFAPERCGATGLAVWRYDGGPWTLVRRHPFAAGVP